MYSPVAPATSRRLAPSHGPPKHHNSRQQRHTVLAGCTGHQPQAGPEPRAAKTSQQPATATHRTGRLHRPPAAGLPPATHWPQTASGPKPQAGSVLAGCTGHQPQAGPKLHLAPRLAPSPRLVPSCIWPRAAGRPLPQTARCRAPACPNLTRQCDSRSTAPSFRYLHLHAALAARFWTAEAFP